MLTFLDHFRMALWRAFQHDAFAVAKAAAFSAILTLFPAILVLASVLSFSHLTESLVHELGHVLGRILPEGTSSAVMQYFTANKPVRLKVLLSTIAVTLWTGSGVMV
jgi:membrane protein